MKTEQFNIKKSIYLNKILQDEIIKIANANGITFQNALRYLLKQGIKAYENTIRRL